MGGGGAIRAAAKVAGIGVVNRGLRGMPAVPPAEQSVRNASRPVSAILTSSTSAPNSGSGDVAPAQQMPVPAAWDDWDFADGEEGLVMEAGEPMPRLVFGGVPSFQEAKDATAELKDALDMVYLSSPESTGSVDPFAANPSLSLVSGPALEPVISDATPTPVPRHVFHAFSLLSKSPEAQNVVASIASDPNVWNAVMENPVVQDYFVSLPRNDEFLDVQSDVQSPQPFEESSAESQPGNSDSGFNNIMQNIKVKVLKMVSNASNYFQNLFGHSSAESTSSDANGNTSSNFTDKTIGATFMGLAVMVVMVVVLKRI
uniref:Uncharacterized protein n=1 Tax=Fagus sylvatica TaxID=28930 RepID=A0A2N9HJX9_FAGSY